MKKIILFLSSSFAFLIVTIFFSQPASAEVYGTDSVMNGLITQQQINQTQKPQFSDRNGSSESIDPVTGSLSWKQNNIHLPGREGLDLDIGILYQSNYSFGYMRAYNVPGGIKKYNYLNFRYDLGLGLSFRFPSVQLSDGYTYYHTGEGSVYRVDFNATSTTESYTHLLGYQGKDMRFVQDAGSFSNSEASSAYFLEYASKKREYFAADGRLLGIVDRFGNKITFFHTDRVMYDGQTYKVISSITDTVGRIVTFTYDTNLQTATDANFNGENIVVSVKDPSNVVVQSVTYTKWRSSSTLDGNPDGFRPYLWKITKDQEATYLGYNGNTGSFEYSQKYFDSTSGYNSFFLLKDVSYPNSRSNYQFETVTRNWGSSGIGEEFRVLNRYDQLWKYDVTQPSGSQWSLIGDINHTNNAYTGDYTGFPTYYDPNSIPVSYNFSSTATLQSTTSTNGLKTISAFNGKGQPYSTETLSSNGERKLSTNLSFHPTFTYLPTSIQMADYAIGDNDSTANKLFVNRQYTEWGGLQNETQPLTQTQLNDTAMQSKYTTTYIYEPNFNQLQSKSWYQNVSDTASLTESYAYDNNGRPTSITNAKGEVTSTCYDIVDANGAETTSCAGGVTPLLGKVKKVTTTKNLNNGKTAKTTTIFGSETDYAYPNETNSSFTTTDASGQPVTQIVKKLMTYYIGTGLLKEETDGNNKTSYTYDALGRTLEIKYPMFTNLNGVQYDLSDVYDYGHNYTSSAYDSTNYGISAFQVHAYRKYTQKSNGVVTKLNESFALYDGLGNLRYNDFFDPQSVSWENTQYHYDDVARANYVIDPMQNTTTASYDGWGRQNEIADVYGNLYVTEYNLKLRKTTRYFVAAANVSSYRANPGQSNLKANYTEQDEDQWGHLLTTRAFKDLSQTQPITESYTYNILGQVVTYTDPKKNLNNEGATKKYVYDTLNRLVTVKDALSQLTNYQYDYTGNIQQVSMQSTPTDTPVILNTKQYNEAGGLIQKTDPSNLSETYTYNNLGLLNKRVDRNGTVFTNQYDEQNRITESSAYTTGTTQTNKSIIGSSGILYDTLETYLNGAKTGSMQTGMDSMKRITSITMSSTNYSSSLGLRYDSNSRLIQQANNLSGINVNYHYDRQRLTQVQLDGQSAANTAASANASYDYYANGQVKSITYPALSDGTILQTSFTYDALNRLVNITNKKGTSLLSEYSYSYDDNGNIISKTETINQIMQTFSYTYDVLNRLLTISRPDGSTASYTYDLKGNRLTLQDSSANVSFSDTSYMYDLFNRLTSVTAGSGTTSFSYDPNNLRYKKVSPTQTVQYHYNASGQVISESDGNNTVTANYIRGDRLLAKKDVGTSNMYYYLYNGHGDVVQIVDTNGTIVNQYQYDEWGTITSKTEGISNSFKYAGEQYDDETGLYYLRARYYDPSMGRFINEDTYEGQINNPLSLNLYTYVENNPLIYIDPTGNYKESDNEELKKLVEVYGDKWKKANETSCGGIWECEKWKSNEKLNAETAADAVRVSYYSLQKQSLPSDVKYTDKGLQDVTQKLNGLMLSYDYMYDDRNILYIEEFYNLVRNKGELDLKNQPGWEANYFVYNGEIVDNDVPGNISFGYVGKVYHIPDKILIAGAGYAQIQAGTYKKEWINLNNFGDDPRDTFRIQQGIQIYNEWHSK